MEVKGKVRSILSAERLALNLLQRMSGIATKTRNLSEIIQGTNARLLDTRKTTPNFRMFEKWAVHLGGGMNHRFALYDMIMLKDNHNDYAGGITNAVAKAKTYLTKHKLDLRIEVETRTIDEVQEALNAGADIIMLDNMGIQAMKDAVHLINKKCLVEASGGITEENILEIAETGVDYISVGALTHSYKSLDMSLKAEIKR
jgi:nicotinate-nucleotide pyrophosphorylase (carboxylating)